MQNRKIEFRGKRIDTGEWVKGDLCHNLSGGLSIMPKCFFSTVIFIDDEETKFDRQKDGLANGGWFAVIPETVGQLYELPYENYPTVFLDDIVRILYTDWPSKLDTDPRTLEQYKIDLSHIGKVVFKDLKLQIAFWSEKFNEWTYGDLHCGPHGEFEIIGNTIDNPELLKQ